MKEYIEKIEGIGYDGEGVCRIAGKVVFVPRLCGKEAHRSGRGRAEPFKRAPGVEGVS